MHYSGIVKGKNILCKAFYYKKFDFNTGTGVLTLIYEADDYGVFTEEIVFPGAPFCLTPTEMKALTKVFSLTHIAAGISYYKAFLYPKLVVEECPLTNYESEFFNRFYIQGLGEFAIRNNLNLQNRIHFIANEKTVQTPCHLDYPISALIPVGGGKDSCVTTELLKKTGVPVTTVAVGNPRPIQECMTVSKLPHINLVRRIDKRLIELNNTGHVYNGHVPITGILAFVLWAAAILYRRRYIVMSCERSANVGNMMQGDLSINHQYSKSFDFECDFFKIMQSITPDVRYFSMLRPISEAHIAQLFSHHCTDYFSVFTSCNKAFKLDENKRLDRWCGACDKCRFVFLILAPFMDKRTLVSIVGHNPLDDINQIDGYRELLGLKGHKPFECVGEVDECRWSFTQLIGHNDWAQDAVMKALKNDVPKTDKGLIFTPTDTHLIPKELAHVLAEFKL